MENFIKSLPINLYTKDSQKYKLILSQDGERTFINFLNNTITVGMRMFDRLEVVTETSMRSIFYHEISHAILSDIDTLDPSNFSKRELLIFDETLSDFSLTNGEIRHILNIIEDERIETILNGYYHDVDFDNLIKALVEGNTSKDAMSKFFDEVRLEKTEKTRELLQPLLKHPVEYNDYFPLLCYYLHLKEESSESDSGDKVQDKGDSGDNLQNDDNLGDNPQNQDDSEDNQAQNEKTGKIPSDSKDEDKERPEKSFSEEEQTEIVKEAIKRLKKKQEDKSLNEKAKEVNLKSFSIESIIKKIVLKAKAVDQTRARQKGNGYTNNKIDIYAFDDIEKNRYRIFETKNGDKPENRTFIINFIIDRSGSYSVNEDKTNELLAILENLEKKISNFKFTLTTVGTYEIEHEVRRIHCGGGNSITPRLREIYKKLNTKDSFTIFLLDGYTYINDSDLDYLDTPNMFICVDNSNEVYFSHFKKAKLNFVDDSGDYVTELENFISRTLNTILRNI